VERLLVVVAGEALVAVVFVDTGFGTGFGTGTETVADPGALEDALLRGVVARLTGIGAGVASFR